MITNIDWNQMWMESMSKASWRKRHGDMTDFWDRRAERYNESIKQNDRALRVISKMNIDPDWTVMDIGSGPGTLSVPLAKVAKYVTAVEPSTGMLSCLKQNAQDAGVTNINCINKRWEDVVPFDDLDKHDILIASYSLAMLDMKAALSKMNQLAKKYVYLFTFAGGRMWDYDKLWPKLYGEEYFLGPDFIYIYNILYDMGIRANVEITKAEHKQRFKSLDDAVTRWAENLNVDSAESEKIIRSYLSETLIEDHGELWSKNVTESAMIWWRKDDEDE
jgi:ubiquinone/menaquinone biosynthesis C-methylase UbiE